VKLEEVVISTGEENEDVLLDMWAVILLSQSWTWSKWNFFGCSRGKLIFIWKISSTVLRSGAADMFLQQGKVVSVW
jgi:hypothetical protein